MSEDWRGLNSEEFNQAIRDWGRPGAEALVVWSTWIVDSLHYLVALNRQTFAASPGLLGFHPDTVELAHVRWAVGSAITALDLCAAAIARVYFAGEARSDREHDLRSFDTAVGDDARRQRTAAKMDALPSWPRGWLRSVMADSRYKHALRVRHALTHRRLPRSIAIDMSDPDATASRVSLPYGKPESMTPIPKIIADASALATDHVRSFVLGIAAGKATDH